MRIALLSGEYPPQPGGVGDYTQQLGTALAARGHTIAVFTIQGSRFTIYDLSHPERQPQIGKRLHGWGWASWRAVSAALAATRPDVLHIQYQTGAYGMRPAVNLLPWRLRHTRARPRVVVTAHDLLVPYLFPKAGPLRAWVTARLLADADAAVLTNNADLAEAAAMVSHPPTLIPIGSNIAVAPPPGYDRGAWRARLGLYPNTPLIAFFGLISRTKGLDTLLAALAALPAPAHLLIIGGAASAPADREYAAGIGRAIAAEGLAGRVTITGHCPPAEVSAHLLAADLAALPFSDGASFRRGSLLAALAHALPLVTTRPAQPLPELVDGDHAVLVPASDPAALAGAIRRLLADGQLRARLRQNGPALAQRFGWKAIAAQHEALYARICAG